MARSTSRTFAAGKRRRHVMLRTAFPSCPQFLYMLLVGTFPFNSFLAGILCSLSFFSLTGERAGSTMLFVRGS